MAKLFSITGLRCDWCDATIELGPFDTSEGRTARSEAERIEGWSRRPDSKSFNGTHWKAGGDHYDLCAPCGRRWKHLHDGHLEAIGYRRPPKIDIQRASQALAKTSR